MWVWYEGMHWGASFGGVWMVLLWIAIIALIFLFVKIATEVGTKTDTTTTTTTKPLDIIQERYAKGEITREEFEHLKKDLAKS